MSFLQGEPNRLASEDPCDVISISVTTVLVLPRRGTRAYCVDFLNDSRLLSTAWRVRGWAAGGWRTHVECVGRGGPKGPVWGKGGGGCVCS